MTLTEARKEMEVLALLIALTGSGDSDRRTRLAAEYQEACAEFERLRQR